MNLKMYEYRLYPTKKQIETLQWTLDRCRELYNAALQERREMYKYTGKGTTYNQQSMQLPAIKEVREEYRDVYGQVLQDVLRRVDKAYQAFFRRVQNDEKPGFPRFQGENRYDSFTYPQVGKFRGCQIGPSFDRGKLYLPKIGHVKIKLHREIQGKIKICIIKREGKHWCAFFACEVEQAITSSYTDGPVGIDLGLHHFAALSTGDLIENPRHYRQSEQKLIKAQQALSRKKRGSKRRKKAVQRVAKHHCKIRNQRQDFLHQWSRRLVNTYETLVFEDLEPSNMSKRPKAKQDEDGKYLHNGASQKAGLNKSILDAGWGYFMIMCQYKAECAGTVQVIKVDPYKTSQICSGCYVEGPHKDLSERIHTCANCGLVLDRDVNAAVNILNVGINGLFLRSAKKTRAQARTEPTQDTPV